MLWFSLFLLLLTSTAQANSLLLRDLDRQIITSSLIYTQRLIEHELAHTLAETKKAPVTEDDYRRACYIKQVGTLQESELDAKIKSRNKWIAAGQDMKTYREFLVFFYEDIPYSPENFESKIPQLVSRGFAKCPSIQKEIPALINDLSLLNKGVMAMCQKLAQLQFKAGGCRK